jgi:flagellar basal-body rod protein FlgF
MDSGLYAAYTGLMARTQALDTAANNLANAGTVGFRAERDHFASVMAGSMDQNVETASQVGQAVNGFSVLGGSSLDLGQGQLTATGNPLDLAINGSGFFALQTANGVRYTRDGSFTRSSAGVLESSQHEPVLGTDGKPITIPTGAVHISTDGTVSVATADGSSIAGKVGVVDFADRSVLKAEGSNRFAVADGAKPVASNATVQQSSVEGANEDAIHGTMQLVLVQRQAEMMQKAMSVFNNDFDKTATEDLPRV